MKKEANLKSTEPFAAKAVSVFMLFGVMLISGSFHYLVPTTHQQLRKVSSLLDDFSADDECVFDSDSDNCSDRRSSRRWDRNDDDDRDLSSSNRRKKLQDPIDRCGDMSENSSNSKDIEIETLSERDDTSNFRVEARRLRRLSDNKYLYKIYVCPLKDSTRGRSDGDICISCRPSLSFTTRTKTYDVADHLTDIRRRIRNELVDEEGSRLGRYSGDSRDDEDEDIVDSDDYRLTTSVSDRRRGSSELARSGRLGDRDRNSADDYRIHDWSTSGEDSEALDELDKVVRRCGERSHAIECNMRGLSTVLRKYKKAKYRQFSESAAIEFYDSQISSELIEKVASKDPDAVSLADTLISVLDKNYKGLQTRIQNDVLTGLNQSVNQEKADLRTQLDTKVAELGQQGQMYQSMGRPDLATMMNMQSMRLQQDPFVQKAFLAPEINQFMSYYNDLGNQMRNSLMSNSDLNQSDSLRFYNEFKTKSQTSLQGLLQFPIQTTNSVGVLNSNSLVGNTNSAFGQNGLNGTGTSSFMTSPVSSLPNLAGNGLGGNGGNGPTPMPAGTPVNGQLVSSGQGGSGNLPLGMNAPTGIYDPTMGLGAPTSSMPINPLGGAPSNAGINFGSRAGSSTGVTPTDIGGARGR